MPISNGKYVAPTWQNGGPPALDAAELNAISQSIEKNQGDISAVEASIQQMLPALNGKAMIETGSYVGTGTYGSANPNTLTFSFEPKVVLIFSDAADNPGFSPYGFLYGQSIAVITTSSRSTDSGASNMITWNGTEVSWYASGRIGNTSPLVPDYQLNASGKTYCFAAIG